MEYEGNGISGTVPEFGAIFMSNSATKGECLRRKLLGLPSSFANFVKHVKKGMLLFLFEFERGELHGVYRACSDGDMNIVPHAFTSSGSQFPAQVRFTPIWCCNPLSEHEFQDAIRDNYFSRKKFHFGLSEDQVRRLLWLFSSRKIEAYQPQKELTRRTTKSIARNRRVDDDGRHVMNDTVESENPGNDGMMVFQTEYADNALGDANIVNDDRFLTRDRAGDGCDMGSDLGLGIFTEYPGHSQVQARRLSNGGRLMGSDEIINGSTGNCSPGQGIRSDHSVDLFIKAGRAAGRRRFLMSDQLEHETYVGNDIGACISQYNENRFDGGRVAGDGRFLLGDRVGKEGLLDSGFAPVMSGKHRGNSPGKLRTEFDVDNKLQMNRISEYENNGDNAHGPVITADYHRNPLNMVRRATDDGGVLMDRLENALDMVKGSRNGIGPCGSTEPRENPLCPVRMTDDARDLVSDRVDNSRLFADSQVRVRGPTDDRRYMSNRVENECDMNNNLGPHISNTHSGYNMDTGVAADDGRFLRVDKLEDGHKMDHHFRPVFSTEFPAFYQSKLNGFACSSKPPSLEEDNNTVVRNSFALPYSTEQKVSDISFPAYQDAVITRAVPYDPEYPEVSNRHSQSLRIDRSPKSVQDPTPYGSSFNFLSSLESKSSSLYNSQSQGLYKCQDVALSYGDKVQLLTTANQQERSSYRTSNFSSGAGYSERGNTESFAREGYRGSPLPDSLAFMQDPENEINKRENLGPSSFSLGSFKNPSLLYGEPYPKTSQERDGNESSRDDIGVIRLSDCSLSENDLRDFSIHEKSTSQAIEYSLNRGSLHADSPQKKRTSVFARLGKASVARMEDEEYYAVPETSDVDESVEEVMGKLLQSQSFQVKKKRKFRQLDRQYEFDKISKTKKTTAIDCQMDNNDQLMMAMKMKKHANIEEDGGLIAEETRLVDFKRRSIISTSKGRNIMNKSNGGVGHQSSIIIEAETKCSVDNAEAVVAGKKSKRRKLVRPAFTKKESMEEGIDRDNIQDLQLVVSLEGSICKDNPEKLDGYGRGPVDQDRSFENVGSIDLKVPTGSEGYNTNPEPSLDHRGETTYARNLEPSYPCEKCEHGDEELQIEGTKNSAFPDCPEVKTCDPNDSLNSEEVLLAVNTENARTTQDQVAPANALNENATYRDGGKIRELLEEVDNANGIYPIFKPRKR